MAKIKIKNFGPIKEGYLEDDGWLDVRKVTVFIGNQGSGKSTVAKLISTLSWIEKAMVMGTIRQDELNTHNRFLKQLAYQRIEKYAKPDTSIEYIGKAFTLSYIDGKFETQKSKENGYLLPKIMYAPAERNFLSSVDRPDKLKNLPSTLYTFNDEFDAAKNLFASGIDLPINKVRFEYDKLNKLARIVGENRNYELRLSEASSGFQSTVPLFLVTKYLSDSLSAEEDPSIKEYSLEEQKKLDKEIKMILEDPKLNPEIRQAYLRQLSARRKRVCFINIVEEPEQNLFPSSQRSLLFELLSYTKNEGNKLIMTTHSPYIITFLSISIQAAFLKQEIEKSGKADLLSKLYSIVQENAQVKSDEVQVYELNEIDGTISSLPNPYGIPSDKNYLNQFIRKGNEVFDSLLELEEEL
ncbi:MAG: ATP-binding protein [Microscillaceae bacterium]|nr:ATP-binding protein [Microscillaceae bacterium]